ncbi:MAG: HEAT repeat domain-containing protein [Verrucomicrobiae bacterium]|nr:HEAT repeat domain-containing protein [Verrucomicrobiae bacterium]
MNPLLSAFMIGCFFLTTTGVGKDLQQELERLRNKDAVVRYKAAGALGDMGEQAAPAIPDLIDHLDDAGGVMVCITGAFSATSTESVSDAVQHALAKIGKPAIPLLIQAAESPNHSGSLRQNAIEILGRIPGDEAIPSLLKWADGSEVNLRRPACLALGNLKNRRAIPQLLQLLKRDEADIRANAAISLGMIGDASAGEHLAPLLRDSNIEVRRRTAAAVGRLAYQPAAAELVPLLDDNDLDIRQKAASAFQQIKAPAAAVSKLVEFARGNDKILRHNSEEALRRVNDPAAAKPLIAAMSYASPGLKKILIMALENTRSVEAIEPFRELLNSPELDFRRMAAIGLSHIADPQAAAILFQALRDEDKTVQNIAEHALVKMTDPAIRDTVMEIMKSGSSREREVAARMLPNLRNSSNPAALLESLKDPDENVRAMAIRSLGQLRCQEAFFPIIEQYLNANQNTGLEITCALSHLTEAYTKDPQEWLSWWEWKKRHPQLPINRGAKLLNEMSSARTFLKNLVTLADGPENKRQHILADIAKSRDKEWLLPLESLLSDRNPEIRENAAQTMAAVVGHPFKDINEWEKWWKQNRGCVLKQNQAEGLPIWDMALVRRILTLSLPPAPPLIPLTTKHSATKKRSAGESKPDGNASSEASSSGWPSLKLEALLGDTAIINGKTARAGDKIKGVTVVEIGEDHIKLQRGEETRTLRVGEKS